jgi:serine/threonine protein kinase
MTDQEPKTPLIAGRYELVSLAGEGGMATVWRSIMHGAAGFSRPVAVKRILPNLVSNDDFIRMFVEEARVGSLLQHPNVVQILDFNVDERGYYFLVMEWVEGIDLGRYLQAYRVRELPTKWPLIAAMGIEALRGLSAAHERLDDEGQPSPVIHRDVTPQNILVGTNGVVKLTDFGLSRAMDRSRMTHPDVIKGKLAYLAPEISHGEAASPQSDLFSLAVVLWEALAGRRLYEGANDVEVFLAARKAEIPPLAEHRSDLPEPLVRTIEKALSHEPSERFRDALVMARALAEVLRRQPQKTDAPELAHSVRAARRVVEQARVETAENPAVGQPAAPAKPPAPPAGAARPAPPPVPTSSLQFDIDVVKPLYEETDSISLTIDLDELLSGRQSGTEIEAIDDAVAVPLTKKKDS